MFPEILVVTNLAFICPDGFPVFVNLCFDLTAHFPVLPAIITVKYDGMIYTAIEAVDEFSEEIRPTVWNQKEQIHTLNDQRVAHKICDYMNGWNTRTFVGYICL